VGPSLGWHQLNRASQVGARVVRAQKAAVT